jgi:hypothetical protein
MLTSSIVANAAKLLALLAAAILCLLHPALCQSSDDMPGMDMGAPPPDTARAAKPAPPAMNMGEAAMDGLKYRIDRHFIAGLAYKAPPSTAKEIDSQVQPDIEW